MQHTSMNLAESCLEQASAIDPAELLRSLNQHYSGNEKSAYDTLLYRIHIFLSSFLKLDKTVC